MAKRKKVLTQRGFEDYATVPEDRYGNKVIVRESSNVGSAVWIFCHPGASWKARMVADKAAGHDVIEPAPHLSVAQAKTVIKGLQRFIKEHETV